MGPNSFVDSRQPYYSHIPPPRHFTDAELLDPLPVLKEDILRGLVCPADKGGLICMDEEMMER